MVTAVMTDVHYRMSLALIRDLAQAGVRTVCCEREGGGDPLPHSPLLQAVPLTGTDPPAS